MTAEINRITGKDAVKINNGRKSSLDAASG